MRDMAVLVEIREDLGVLNVLHEFGHGDGRGAGAGGNSAQLFTVQFVSQLHHFPTQFSLSSKLSSSEEGGGGGGGLLTARF